ncbi:nucleotidyltransferase family protein [Thalassoroseus pseudoceratinae]|uniref:nucleotidyltransferase family protein n=1 Tax=Thalassoroseus pseudoceratinae TaxID=2713176 RepID=UPI00141FC5F0|nr:nucleotidyltransferase family protein [Thalassoroseus pseudoceratinae]
MPSGRVFVIIPAAGHSRRMGQPKLLLPIGQQTVIERLLNALDSSRVTERLVVMRKDDVYLADAVRAANATVIQPDHAPPDMRSSVEVALTEIACRFSPNTNDAWMLTPADYPLISRDTVESLLATWMSSNAKILIPTHEGRRGHPVIFRWTLADHVAAIPADQGLNTLVREFASEVEEVAVNDPAIRLDMDTPTDYERLRQLAFKDPA